MFRILDAVEAVKLIGDNAVIGLNSFAAIGNPEKLHDAITKRFRETGHPKNLTIISSSGFGLLDPDRGAEQYIREGAVGKIIASHYGTMPIVRKLVLQDLFEAYNVPLGPMSHAIRAQAGGHDAYYTKLGLGLFVDPRVEGPALNSISHDDSLVRLVEIEGEEYLRYRLPAPDVALIKATSVDANGNVSFENEYCSIDALSLAQLTHRNHGKVIVQVDRLRSDFRRPRDVMIPAALVDAVVVYPQDENNEVFGTLSGDIHVPSTHMEYWYSRLEEENAKVGYERDDLVSSIIGRRAADELRPGDIVNIGIGIPEKAAKFAAEKGILRELTLTVESGGMGGLPAGGRQFGAMIGAGSISDMSMQFDFYDGGGLDRCFMGALEMDRFGNVNAHRSADYYAGVGGFCNITAATKNVIFCMAFSARGLTVSQEDGKVRIEKEGSIPKIVENVRGISFSGQKAVENGQNVLYITERCVFALRPEGLALVEVYPGIDKQKDILDKLPFEVIDEVGR
ncbi:MAG: propionate CoA-transferase [Lachnospiraceae bacterium]|nr:propionate CoA-transferase [Lachnospiraceae bacterium]